MLANQTIIQWVVGVLAVAYGALWLVKVLTGVHLGRFGYLSLRFVRIPIGNGVDLYIDFVGIRFHRPTITRPTWISLVVQGTDLQLDMDELQLRQTKANNKPRKPNQSGPKALLELFERIRDYSSYSFLRWIDVLVLETRVEFRRCAKFQLGSILVSLAHKRKHGPEGIDGTADLQHDLSAMLGTAQKAKKRGLHVHIQCSNLQMQLENQEPVEIMDIVLINVWSEFHGPYIFQNAGISCRFSRLDLDLVDLLQIFRQLSPSPAQLECAEKEVLANQVSAPSISSDDKAVARIVMHILSEIQIHVGFMRLKYEADDVAPSGKAAILKLVAKDVVFDLNTLSPQTPDFRMLFDHGVLAHQALISLIAVTIHLSTKTHEETLLSVPMLTVALKGNTLGTYCATETNTDTDSDSSISGQTIVNTVITSPSSDLHASTLPVVLALCRPRVKRTKPKKGNLTDRFGVAGFPRIQFSLSIHDPSIRVILDAAEGLSPMIIGRLGIFSIEGKSFYECNKYSLAGSARITAGRVYYHSPQDQEFDILQADHVIVRSSCFLLPLANGNVDCVLDGVRLELTKPEVIDCVGKVVDSFHSDTILPEKLPAPRQKKVKVPVSKLIPKWLESFKFETKRFCLELAGIDKEVAPDLRGVQFLLDDFSVDYAKSNVLTSNGNHDDNKDAHHLVPEPVFREGQNLRELEQNKSHSKQPYLNSKALATLCGLRLYSIQADSIVDKNLPIVVLPLFDLSLAHIIEGSKNIQDVSFRARDLSIGFSLFKLYATLQALNVVRTAFLRNRSHMYSAEESAGTASTNEAPNEDVSLELWEYTMDGKVSLVRIKTCLPLNEDQMLDLDHLSIRKRSVGGVAFDLRYARLYVISPTYPDHWDRILSIRDVQVSRETHTERGADKIESTKTFCVRSDALRIRIPHSYIFYHTVEALINTIKSSTQIVHRFITQTNDYVIAQHPKSAKELPRIRVKSRMVAIEVEDDPFESRLGLIFRVGLAEQLMRESREVAFDRKVAQLREEQTTSESPQRSSISGTNGARQDTRNPRDSRSSFQHVPPSDSEENSSSAYPEVDFSWEREKLHEHSSLSWIRRIQRAIMFSHQKMQEIRNQKWGKDGVSNIQIAGSTDKILPLNNRPPLFSMTFSGVDLVVNKPSFPLSHLPDYLHRVGRGMPRDMQYGLLIPINLNWKMDEARVQIRDYPLPVLHIPPLHSSQRSGSGPGTHAWEFSTDLVIAEEFPELEAIRHVDVCIIPANTGRKGSPAFNVDVQRTASPVKIYAEMSVDLGSSLPTRVHWGTSMQPGTSDVMRILDTLSKPQQDPSPKLGFWDKLALTLHISMKLAWKHDGDLHITIKGSRDPYVVLGSGAGLTKVFRGNVRWAIGATADPRNLMEVTCDEYMLAIPDFSRRLDSMERIRSRPAQDEESKNSLHSHHLMRKDISFQKVLMKLTGDVHWTAGLSFERHCEAESCQNCGGKSQCRLWDFLPHWEVKVRIPEYSILPGGKLRDAFKDFRSHFIHGQISVTSKVRNDSNDNYNSMHLTPKTFAHFFDWIHSFSGNLSLPIRTGALFPSAEGPKQKFGSHLMTLKYNLQLEPLYASHVYKSTNAKNSHQIDMTGVKARIDSFTLDLHQRKEERVVTNKQLQTERRSQHMAIYKAQVDLKGTDLRAMTAQFKVDHSHEAQTGSSTKNPLDPANDPRGKYAARHGDFDVPADDVSWTDMDDFVELDTLLPENSPNCTMTPLAFTPRMIYYRDTTHREGLPSENQSSDMVVPAQHFGNEKTHKCSMIHEDRELGKNRGLGVTQETLWTERKQFIENEMQANERRMEDVKARLEKIPHSQALNDESTMLAEHHEMLTAKSAFVEHLARDVGHFLATEMEDNETFGDVAPEDLPANGDEYMQQILSEVKSFNNRFIVHNIQMKWNNTLRNVLIRYIQHVSQRRGFSYYMSQKAVRFLTTIIEEQVRTKEAQTAHHASKASKADGADDNNFRQEHNAEVEELIRQLLDDKEHFFVADETAADQNNNIHDRHTKSKVSSVPEGLNEKYESVNNYIFRLIAPQIQLQSERNKDSAVVLAAQGMLMKILAINDKSIARDDVSVLVQRRFTLKMTGAQFFSAHQRDFHGAIANLLTQNTYGSIGESCWPPWVPIESVYDFESSPRAFDRIVNRTSSKLTYVKNNNLRIKKNDRVGKGDKMGGDEAEDRTDSVTVNFPKFNLTANSEQYYAMYTIVMDLLMYSEPLQKERNEQIEKILLAADFSDLSGAPELVSNLQKRIRQMNELKMLFKLKDNRNDANSKRDESRVQKTLDSCEDELFFLMKSIATAQQKHEDRDSEVVPAMKWHLTADDILWHLMEGDKAFIDFGLSNASFQRTDHSDSSNFNTLEIEMMQGINLSPDPIFAEMFAPYFGKDRTVLDARHSKMVRVYWYMLEAIGGIPICDHFEVNLFPLRLQMEHEVGKKIMAYVFPEKQESKVHEELDLHSDSDSNSDSETSDSSNSDSSSDVEAESARPFSQAKRLLKKSSKLSIDRIVHPQGKSLSTRPASSHLKPDSASIPSQTSAARSSRLTRTTSHQSLARSAMGSTSATKSIQLHRRGKTGSADDLTAMMHRANQNMSLVYVKLPSVILSLSFKGSKAKNFTDVTDFVFRLPTIEYRNKTWSRLDLAEHLKREVIRAVLAHTGLLLKDKMTKNRRAKSRQPILARQLTSYQSFVPVQDSEQHALKNSTPSESFAASSNRILNRTDSAETSSIAGDSHNHGIFNNAIGRHLQHLSHMARHKDGLSEDNPDSSLKKTRMLLGKFIDKAK